MRYRFAECELDREERRLWRKGREVAVTPQVLDLLLELARRPGVLVANEALRRALWPGRVVEESALRRVLKDARRAVGDDGRRQAILETARGRGLRLAAPVEIAGAGALGADVPYVGREGLLRELASLAEQGPKDGSRIVLIRGEPGVGKTRTAEELAERARLAGASVHTVRSSDRDGASAYGVWARLLRALLGLPEAPEASPTGFAKQLSGVGRELGALLPELAHYLPPAPVSPPTEPAAFRQGLVEAIRGLLANAGKERPRALVIDDLHAADVDSLRLLRELASVPPLSPLLVVATYREDELEAGGSAAELLDSLRSQPSVSSIALPPFERAETKRFTELLLERPPSDELVGVLQERTRGNPFYVAEMLRVLVAQGSLSEDTPPAALREIAPEGARRVVAERLALLEESTRALLRCAAAVGERFDRETLLRLQGKAGDDAPAVDEALDEARRLRLIREEIGAPGRFRFGHSLLREALYAELDAAARGRLHARIAAAIERGCGASRNETLEELIHHLSTAGEKRSERALELTIRAARQATELRALHQAARRYERALEILEASDAADPRRLCELLIALGEVCRDAPDRERGRVAFARAAEIARRHGWSELLARAALGHAGFYLRYRPPGETVVYWLETALACLDSDAEGMRARLLARLTAEYTLGSDPARRRRLQREALRSAQRSGEVSALSDVLLTPYAQVWDAASPEERWRAAEQCVERGQSEGDRSTELRGRLLRLDELLARGEIDRFDLEMETLEEMAEELHVPSALWRLRLRSVSRALLEGRFREAERLSQEGLAQGQRFETPNALEVFGAQSAVLRIEEGAPEAVPDSHLQLLQDHPSVAARALAARIYTERGDLAAARRVFDGLAERDLSALAEQPSAVANAALLAEVAANLRDPRFAESWLDLLEPEAGRNLFRGVIACHGPVDRYRGLLAALLERWDEAQRFLESAEALARRMGAWPWLARTQLDLARVLRARGGAGNRERARELADDARRRAEALGIRTLIRERRDPHSEREPGLSPGSLS